MDWAKTVRALRTKLRLKQGTLADLIGVSQTYVSRLEAGTVEPAPDVAAALNKLRENPQTRSVFDDFTASVRHSPFHCGLYEPADDQFQVIATSARLRADLPDLTEALDADFTALRDAGLEEGRLCVAESVWQRVENGNPSFWRTFYAPVRDETGAWFVHLTLKPVTAADYDQFRSDNSDILRVTQHQLPTPG